MKEVFKEIFRVIGRIPSMFYLLTFGSIVMVLAACIGMWNVITFKNYG